MQDDMARAGQLWVTLPDGTHGAVAPVDRRGSGDGHVRLVHVLEGSRAAETVAEAQEQGLMAVLPPNSSAALQAFAEQIDPGRRSAAAPWLRAGRVGKPEAPASLGLSCEGGAKKRRSVTRSLRHRWRPAREGGDRESRAPESRAKATEAVRIPDGCREGLPGVWGMERFDGDGGNWGGPPWPGSLRQECCRKHRDLYPGAPREGEVGRVGVGGGRSTA